MDAEKATPFLEVSLLFSKLWYHYSAQASYFAAFRGIRDTKIEKSLGIQDKISKNQMVNVRLEPVVSKTTNQVHKGLTAHLNLPQTSGSKNSYG